ncbi:ribose-5-phosphate isomerase RpiA [Suttonella ornithocola]|uniref:Ribose-5-phosphate isomerase A n=1 Tax=Suttonella ornithocola TaxID=279832 RepID=A0A380N024_9GAMM|nr:ribose-5-phosphate isomerase RpiA [Suttonella ornithocola]SUO97271.1 Ribose-5-phosphate isomerase A [Suttonella ornithocola]
MNQQEMKRLVAESAVAKLKEGITLGVGSGSTVLCFIEALGKSGLQFKDVVAASESSAEALRKVGYQVRDLNACDPIDIYVDGCDEIDATKCMIKGGGAALTREKIIAAASAEFLCIVDESKKVNILGKFPLPVEVIPMARSYVARELAKLGGEPRWREGVVTDNGNWILDVYYFEIIDPIEMEAKINNIAGVVTVGIFAQQKAHIVLMSTQQGTVEEW